MSTAGRGKKTKDDAKGKKKEEGEIKGKNLVSRLTISTQLIWLKSKTGETSCLT